METAQVLDSPPLPITSEARTIWERRAEVGLRAPDAQSREAIWRRMRLLAIDEGRSGYDPWPSFLKAHLSPAQIIYTVGSERVGKSIATAAEGMAWIPDSRLIWIAGPQYRDTLKEFWYMAEACLNLGIVEKGAIRSTEKGPSNFYTENGTKIETRSLYDIERTVVAEAPDLILVVEAGNIPVDPTEKLRLRVSTRRGRVLFSGTIEEASPWLTSARERLATWPNDENAFAISVPLYENTQDFPGGDENPEILSLRKNLRPQTYAHRVLGRPAPSELLVFAKTFQRGNIPMCARPRRLLRLDENRRKIPVSLCVDPGRKPSFYAAEFIQKQGDQWCVVDEVAMSETHHEAVCHEVMRRPAWENTVDGVIDPWAGKQHGMGYLQSPHDIWLAETGLDLVLPEPAPTPLQIVDRYWYFLVREAFAYDPDKAPRLDEEWRKWKFDRDVDGKPIKTEPSKRWCDAIKAIGYFLWWRFGEVQKLRIGRAKPATSSWRFS